MNEDKRRTANSMIAQAQLAGAKVSRIDSGYHLVGGRVRFEIYCKCDGNHRVWLYECECEERIFVCEHCEKDRAITQCRICKSRRRRIAQFFEKRILLRERHLELSDELAKTGQGTRKEELLREMKEIENKLLKNQGDELDETAGEEKGTSLILGSENGENQ